MCFAMRKVYSSGNDGAEMTLMIISGKRMFSKLW